MIDDQAPLWIGLYAPHGDPLPRAAEIERQRSSSMPGLEPRMWTWGLNKGDENIVREGQNVVLVRNTSHRPEPGGMATAYQPAKVVHVVRHSQRDDPVAILAAEPDAPTFRFHQIKGAAASVNSTVDWNKTLDPRTAAAVYRLWTAAIPS